MKTNGVDINRQECSGYTALMRAYIRGHTEVALELLKADGLDVNNDGCTALIWACIYGLTEVALELLRDSRVDRHIIDSDGKSALDYAHREGGAVVTRFEALDRGDKRMPLVKVHRRYLHGDVAAEGVQALRLFPKEAAEAHQPNHRQMEQPADSPENSRPDGAEPASEAEGGVSASEHKEKERLDSEALIDAAEQGELARVKEIIGGMKTNGVDINRQECSGYTALMRACANNDSEVALELLKIDGLDINIQSNDGCTALIWACIYGRAFVALELLRDPRVDRHIIDSWGDSALDHARREGVTAVVTRFEALDRGDKRMPLVKVHHRYLHGDGAAEGAEARAPHPPESAITKTLVDKNLMHYMSRFLAP